MTISAAAPSVVTGERYVWNGWTGSGSVSYTGNDNPATLAVTMNGPVTETASWTHEFELTMATNADSLQVRVLVVVTGMELERR